MGMPRERLGQAFAVTLALHLTLFGVPAALAWWQPLTGSGVEDTMMTVAALVTLAALPLSLVVGIGLVLAPPYRVLGAGVLTGTAAATVAEAGLVLALIVAYSSANPGWDLS